MRLSPIVSSMSESATLLMARRSRELRAAGRDIIDLSLGEPDHDPPAFALDAAREALNGNWHKYSPVNGYADVREAIANKFERDNGLSFTPDQIVVSTGAKQALINVIMSLVGPGDEVVIPAPFWVSYVSQVQLAGGIPVIVKSTLEEDWKVPVERIAAAITPKTRLIMFSSPCNPSGSVLTRSEHEALAEEVAKHKDLYVIADEIYEHLAYAPARFTSFARLCPEAADLTVLVNGMSKAFSMTGWRIGFAGGSADLIGRMVRLQGHATSGPPGICQKAAVAALTGPMDSVYAMRDAFDRRRQAMVAGLKGIEGLDVPTPDGAFYALPGVGAFLGRTYEGRRLAAPAELAEALLDREKVAVVAGEPFGAPTAIRLSYACSEATIAKGIERLSRFFGALR